jgi:O-acetyl-ADP-ribose deacetylase (regulator of RNase III)
MKISTPLPAMLQSGQLFPGANCMGELKAETILPTGERLKLVHGDLTLAEVGAVVNAANQQLVHGGGVAAAIVRRGGEVIQAESDAWVRDSGPITHGSPAITSAGRMPSRYVIHAVGPIWGEGDEDKKLHDAVYSALQMADRHEVSSIGFPAISTGIFGFPKDRGAVVIIDAILDFFVDNPGAHVEEVQIVLIDEPSILVFLNEFQQRWPGSE